MTFRLHCIAASLLFPAMIFAQTPAGSASPKTPAQAAAKSLPARTPGGPYAVMSAAAQERAQKVFGLFNSGQSGALWATFNDGLKKRAVSEAKFGAFIRNMQQRVGVESKMLKESAEPVLGMPATIYSRLSEFTKANVPVITTIEIDEHGMVNAFTVGPESQPTLGRFGGYKDKAQLRLPFNDEWFVYQAGRSTFDSVYFASDDHRFAIDFVLLKNGQPFSVDGTSNDQFYCFGQPVLAPADGTVVQVEDGYPDNMPGEAGSSSPNGNRVLISHGGGEFSSLTTLKQNSITVKKGDKVKQGEVIGACGNSGRVLPAPHIHYELVNSAGIPFPETLPVQFVNYMLDGKLVPSGELVKGQTVSNGPMPSTPAPATK